MLNSAQDKALEAKLEQERRDRVAAKREPHVLAEDHPMQGHIMPDSVLRERRDRIAEREAAKARKERDLFDGETRSDGSPWATETPPRD